MQSCFEAISGQGTLKQFLNAMVQGRNEYRGTLLKCPERIVYT